MATNQVLSDEQKREFMTEGYILLPGAVSASLTQAALQVVDRGYNRGELGPNAAEQNGLVKFEDPAIAAHPDVGGLLQKARLIPVIEDLLGVGNVQYGHVAQVAVRPKDDDAIRQGTRLRDEAKRKGYHTDAANGVRFAGTGTPFNVLVGVCLSPGQHVDENRGQFTVWPGSHKILHPIVRERWQKGLIEGRFIYGGPMQKPDIGSPKRLLMHPGDVVLAHQRLGHTGGINVSDITRKNLYFRIRHTNFDNMVETILREPPFYAFEGLHHLLSPDEMHSAPTMSNTDASPQQQQQQQQQQGRFPRRGGFARGGFARGGMGRGGFRRGGAFLR